MLNKQELKGLGIVADICFVFSFPATYISYVSSLQDAIVTFLSLIMPMLLYLIIKKKLKEKK